VNGIDPSGHEFTILGVNLSTALQFNSRTLEGVGVAAFRAGAMRGISGIILKTGAVAIIGGVAVTSIGGPILALALQTDDQAEIKEEIAIQVEDAKKKHRKLLFYHYSQDGPASFAVGLIAPAWVTTLGGLDSKDAMFGFSIPPPKFEYKVLISPDDLGPVNTRTPGGWPYVQYEVLRNTGPGSVIDHREVKQTH